MLLALAGTAECRAAWKPPLASLASGGLVLRRGGTSQHAPAHPHSNDATTTTTTTTTTTITTTTIPTTTSSSKRSRSSINSPETTIMKQAWSSTGYMRSSPRVDADGFLHEVFEVVDGCEEETGHRPGWSTPFSPRALVRQVPGDGSCLFHALSAALCLAEGGAHADAGDIAPLLARSARLRALAVDALEGDRAKKLWVQGGEAISCGELLAAVSEQYGISPEAYCAKLRKPSEWGGGPEIVALANALRRPIHVYELVAAAGRGEAAAGAAAGGTGGSAAAVMPGRAGAGAAAGDGDGDEVAPSASGFRLRRIACFGSPRFDWSGRRALHVLSADSRFPDLTPGSQLASGNHFLAIFPCGRHPGSAPVVASPTARRWRDAAPLIPSPLARWRARETVAAVGAAAAADLEGAAASEGHVQGLARRRPSLLPPGTAARLREWLGRVLALRSFDVPAVRAVVRDKP